MKVGLSLKVENESLVGHNAKVTLDGNDISYGLQELDIHIGVHDATTARLTLLIDELEVDAAVLAALEAHVADPEARIVTP